MELTEGDKALARAIVFDEEVLRGAKSIDGKVQRLKGVDDEGFERECEGISIDVSHESALSALRGLREYVEPLGYRVYRYEMNFGLDPDRIAVLKTGDKFEIARLMWTNGINYGSDNATVIKKLREWDERFGLDLIGAGLDWVEAEFVRPPEDMSAFAKEVYAFCPDVVDQGTALVGRQTDPVEALAKEMEQANTVYLWWD